jgi:hypothetical protein
MESIQCHIAARIYRLRMAGLLEYCQTMERLLLAEFASAYSRETLSQIAQRVRGHDYIGDESSKELESLRDIFPCILRGSLFTYLVSTFENQTRKYSNEKFGRKVIYKGDKLSKVCRALIAEMPGVFDTKTLDRFSQYKHLRTHLRTPEVWSAMTFGSFRRPPMRRNKYPGSIPTTCRAKRPSRARR